MCSSDLTTPTSIRIHSPNSTSSHAHAITAYRKLLNRHIDLSVVLPQCAILIARPLTQRVGFAVYPVPTRASEGRYSSKAQVVHTAGLVGHDLARLLAAAATESGLLCATKRESPGGRVSFAAALQRGI